MKYEIVPASILHVKPLSINLRPSECATLLGFGIDPRVALRHAFLQSIYARTALIDGYPVAMWGATGLRIADQGDAWAAFGKGSLTHPLAIVREGRKELARMRALIGTLCAKINMEDDRALIFARTLGFSDTGERHGKMLLMEMGGN